MIGNRVRNIHRAETRAHDGVWYVWNDREGRVVASCATEDAAKAEVRRLNAQWRAMVRKWRAAQ